MGVSINRNIYFEKNIKNQVTPQEYILALAQSPYRLHRRMAQALVPQFKELLKETEESDAEDSEVIPTSGD